MSCNKTVGGKRRSKRLVNLSKYLQFILWFCIYTYFVYMTVFWVDSLQSTNVKYRQGWTNCMRKKEQLFSVNLTKDIICSFRIVLLVTIVFAVIVIAEHYVFHRFRIIFASVALFRVKLGFLPFKHDFSRNIVAVKFIIEFGHEFRIIFWEMLVTCKDPGRCSC